MSGALIGRPVPAVIPPTLGAVVREQRRGAGLTLRNLATLCEMTVTEIGAIERGVSAPDASVLAIVFAKISGARPVQTSSLADLGHVGPVQSGTLRRYK